MTLDPNRPTHEDELDDFSGWEPTPQPDDREALSTIVERRSDAPRMQSKPHKALIDCYCGQPEHAYSHACPAPMLREVLEAIRGSKTFAMLTHQLQDRVHGALRR